MNAKFGSLKKGFELHRKYLFFDLPGTDVAASVQNDCIIQNRCSC